MAQQLPDLRIHPISMTLLESFMVPVARIERAGNQQVEMVMVSCPISVSEPVREHMLPQIYLLFQKPALH